MRRVLPLAHSLNLPFLSRLHALVRLIHFRQRRCRRLSLATGVGHPSLWELYVFERPFCVLGLEQLAVLFRLIFRPASRRGGLSDPFELGVNVSCIENFVNVRYAVSVVRDLALKASLKSSLHS